MYSSRASSTWSKAQFSPGARSKERTENHVRKRLLRERPSCCRTVHLRWLPRSFPGLQMTPNRSAAWSSRGEPPRRADDTLAHRSPSPRCAWISKARGWTQTRPPAHGWRASPGVQGARRPRAGSRPTSGDPCPPHRCAATPVGAHAHAPRSCGRSTLSIHSSSVAREAGRRPPPRWWAPTI